MQTWEQLSSHRSPGWPSVLETYDNVASTTRHHGADDVLSRMLPQLSHLDLTGRISNTDATMEAHGGYCDIFVGNVASEHLQHRFAIPTGLVVKVAIKRLRVRLGKDEKFTKSLAREIGVWSRLDHPNILPFLGYLLEKEYPSLISEWIGNGTVRDFLRKYPESDVRYLALGIARGLEYIHEQDVVHSDMKADNVLISQTGEPLICDFGISRMLNSSQTFFVSTTHDGAVKGSTRWMAIELHIPGEGKDPKHSKEADVWAYGMTLYELISKEVPYAHLKLDLHILLAVMKEELPIRPSFVDVQSSLAPLWSICANCWKKDPKARLTVAQIAQELACLEWEQPVQHQTEMIPCQVGQANFGWSSSNEQEFWFLTGMSLPPPARERYLVMMQDWWRREGIKPDRRMITIGNRQIHQLHTKVLQYGGVVNVRRHDLWDIIAAKMGWTPASIYEAGRTQVQVAEQLKVVYEQLLESFEVTYMPAAMKQPLTAQPQQTADQQGGPSQPSAGPSQPSGPNQQLSTPQAMHMTKLANISAEQMRAAGYPEDLIQNIEQNRPALQATWRRMQMQRILAQQRQQQQQQQQGAGLNPPLPFQNQHQAQTALHNSSPLQTQGSIPNANALSHPGFSAGSGQSNDMPAQQRPQLNAQNLTPQNMQMLSVLSNLREPDPESIKHALSVIDQMKQDISKERSFRPEHAKHLSDAEKRAFPGLFEALCNVIKDVFKSLHMYLASTNDVDIVRGLLNLYDMCDKQRQLVQSASPIYVLDVAMLQRLMKTAVELKAKVLLVMQQLRIMSQADTQNQAHSVMQQQIDGGLPPPSAAQQGLSPQNLASSPASVPPRPPTTQPQPPQIPQQNLRVLPTRTPQMSPARPTPLPASAMPSHLQVSPQTLKSPRPKAQPKPRPRQRRASKIVPPNANATSATTTAAAVASASNSITEPAPRAPSPAESSLKRPREEDVPGQSGSTLTPGSTNEEIPSKRIKNDWENVPDAEPPKRQVEAESIKPPGQAAHFYSDMTQILELSNNSVLSPHQQEPLAQLVNTVWPSLVIPDAAGSSSMPNLTSAGPSSLKAADGNDSFFSFLDFTAFQQEDDRADTPDLVPTSSTNPSSESGAGSEADHPPVPASSGSAGDRAKIIDTSESEPRPDFFDSGSDPLRLGFWGEIDGGESGYFNSSDMWKWDSVPPSSGDNFGANFTYSVEIEKNCI